VSALADSRSVPKSLFNDYPLQPSSSFVSPIRPMPTTRSEKLGGWQVEQAFGSPFRAGRVRFQRRSFRVEGFAW